MSQALSRLIGMIALLPALGACGSEQGSSGGDGGTAGSAGSAGTSGGKCESPDCGGCQLCFDSCKCQTGNVSACVQACSSTGGAGGAGGGVGGSAGSGQGGTGTGGSGQGGTGTGGSGQGGTTGGSAGTGQGGSGAGGSGGLPPDIQTVTIKTTPFTLAPGEEAFRCQNFANPFPGDVAVVLSESSMTAGSHHMFVFYNDGNNSAGPLQACSGLEFGRAVHSSQTPNQLITYPDGVGRRVNQGTGFRILMHYFNTQPSPIEATVTVQFHYVAPDQIQYEAGSLFLNNLGVRVGPNQAGQATQTCRLPYDIKLIGAVSHMHSFAKKFLAETDNGTVIYEGTEWDEPEPRGFSPPLELAANTRITYTCDYVNTTSNTLTFGDSAQTNEMCILSGTYYPAPAGATLSCQ
jgi:hypothetical protein